MRDYVLGAIILSICGYALRHPWVGALGWTWISIMNPHAYSWDLNRWPVAAGIAGSTVLGMMLTKDKLQFFMTKEMAVLLMFVLWMSIGLPFSLSADNSYEMWKKIMKIDFMIFITIFVLHTKKHISLFAWILVGSIGFYGVKGGIFTITTGGNFRVWGPSLSYIEGNNEVALALVMIIPLMRFLYLTVSSVWLKRALLVSMVLCAVAALGSQSRGALVAIAAMGAILWWRFEKKMMATVVLAIVTLSILSFMPETWWDRMATIGTYDEDASAMGRINAWWMTWNLAKDNFMGGGFSIYNAEIFARYAPNPKDVHAAHSIYFMILGEHGFVGLGLFLLIWLFVWISAGRLRVKGKLLPQTLWLSHLGGMCQVSLIGYLVGGAFLSLAYYDLPYNLLVLVVLGNRWLDNKAWIDEEQAKLAEQMSLQSKSSSGAG